MHQREINDHLKAPQYVDRNNRFLPYELWATQFYELTPRLNIHLILLHLKEMLRMASALGVPSWIEHLLVCKIASLSVCAVCLRKISSAEKASRGGGVHCHFLHKIVKGPQWVSKAELHKNYRPLIPRVRAFCRWTTALRWRYACRAKKNSAGRKRLVEKRRSWSEFCSCPW